MDENTANLQDAQDIIAEIKSSEKKKDEKKKKKGKLGCKRLAAYGLFAVIMVVVVLALTALLFPDFFLIIVNIMWLVALSIALIFLLLGILVMIGLKKEAQELMNIILEGSLTIIDLADFFKEAWRQIKKNLRDLIYMITPGLAFLAGMVLYVILMYIYKYVGKDNDVTTFTLILAGVMTVVVGIFNRPKPNEQPKNTWFAKFKHRFSDSFKDALEVVIFIFFLTMDSTNLFFLPKELNVELHSMVGDYNLMLRGFTVDEHFRITLSLVMFAVLLEVIRKVLKLAVNSVQNYQLAIAYLEKKEKKFKTADVIKLSLRQSVKTSQDELMKFITFTSILIFVFILFPRLKLVTMVVASAASLVLDLTIRQRLKVDKGDDLISRIISKVFNL